MTCDEPEKEPEELSKGSSPVNVDRDCGRRLIHDGHGLSYAWLSTLDQRAEPQSCLRAITELRKPMHGRSRPISADLGKPFGELERLPRFTDR